MCGEVVLIDLRSDPIPETDHYKISISDDRIHIHITLEDAIYNIRLGEICAHKKSLRIEGSRTSEVILSHSHVEFDEIHITAKTVFLEENSEIQSELLSVNAAELQVYGLVNTRNMNTIIESEKVWVINDGTLNVQEKYHQTNGSFKNKNVFTASTLIIEQGHLVLNEKQANWRVTEKQNIQALSFLNLGKLNAAFSGISCENAKIKGFFKVEDSNIKARVSLIFDEDSVCTFQRLNAFAKEDCQILGHFHGCGSLKLRASIMNIANSAQFIQCNTMDLAADHIMKCHKGANFVEITEFHAKAPYLYMDASLKKMKEIHLRGSADLIIHSESHLAIDKIFVTGRNIYVYGKLEGNLYFPEKIHFLYLSSASKIHNFYALHVECVMFEAYGKLKTRSIQVLADFSVKTSNTTVLDSFSTILLSRYITLAGFYQAEKIQPYAKKLLHLSSLVKMDSKQLQGEAGSIFLGGNINSNIELTGQDISNHAIIRNTENTTLRATHILLSDQDSSVQSSRVELVGRQMVQDGSISGNSIAEAGEDIYNGEHSRLNAQANIIQGNSISLGGGIIGESLNVEASDKMNFLSSNTIEVQTAHLKASNTYGGHTNLMAMTASIIAGKNAAVSGNIIAGESLRVVSQEISLEDCTIATHQLHLIKYEFGKNEGDFKLRIGNQSSIRTSAFHENFDTCAIAGKVSADTIRLDSLHSAAIRPNAELNFFDLTAIKTEDFHCDGSVSQVAKSSVPKPGFYIEADRIGFDSHTNFRTLSPLNAGAKQAIISGEFLVPAFNIHADNIDLTNGCHISSETQEINLLGKFDTSTLHIKRHAFVESKKAQIQNINHVILEGLLLSREIQIKIKELLIADSGKLGSLESKLFLHTAHVKLKGTLEALDASIKCSRSFIQMGGRLKVIKGNIISLININLGLIEAQQINFTSGIRLGLGLQLTNFTIDNAIINLSLLPRLLHPIFLAKIPRDIKSKKISVLDANFLFYSLQTVLSLLKLILPALSRVANTVISVCCLALQAKTLIQLIQNLVKNKENVELVDLLPLLISLKNIIVSGTYVFTNAIPDLPNDLQNSFTTAQNVDVAAAFAAAGAIFAPANYEDAIINIHLFSPELTYSASQRGIFTFSFASPILAVNDSQVGVGFLGNLSPQLAYNANFSSPYVFQDAPITAHTFQVSSRVYDQEAFGKVRCRVAIIEEDHAHPHDIDVDEKLDLTYNTADDEKDLLKLAGEYSNYQPKDPAHFTVSYKTDHDLKFSESETFDYSVNFEGSSITVDSYVYIISKGELGLASSKGSILMNGWLGADSIVINSADSYEQDAGRTESTHLSIVAENNITLAPVAQSDRLDWVRKYFELENQQNNPYIEYMKSHNYSAYLSIASSNVADDGMIISKHGDVVVDESVVKFNDFGLVRAGGDITVKYESVDTITNSAPDKVYCPGIIEGGGGHDHNGVGLVMHADGKIKNDASEIGAGGDYIVDGDEGVIAVEEHNTYVAYEDQETDWTGVETDTQIITERIQRPEFESKEGSGYINSKHGELNSQCGEFLAGKSTEIHAKTAVFKDFDVRTETHVSVSWLGVVPLADKDEVDDQLLGQKFVSPESLKIKVEEGDLRISNSTIETELFVSEAVEGKTIIRQDPIDHYVHEEYYGFSCNIGPIGFSFSSNPDDDEPTKISVNDPLIDSVNAINGNQATDQLAANGLNIAEAGAGKINSYLNGAGLIDDSVSVGISKTETESRYQTPGENYIRAGAWVDNSQKGIEIDGMPSAIGELKLDGGQALAINGEMLSYSSHTETENVGMSWEPNTGAMNASLSLANSDNSGIIALPCVVKIGRLDLGKDAVISLDNAELSADEIHGSIATLNMKSEISVGNQNAESYSASTNGDFTVNENESSFSDVVPTFVEVKNLSDCHIKEVNSIGGELRGAGFTTNQPDSIHQTNLTSTQEESGFSLGGNFLSPSISSIGYTDLTNGEGVNFNVKIPYNLIDLASRAMNTNSQANFDFSENLNIQEDSDFSNNNYAEAEVETGANNVNLPESKNSNENTIDESIRINRKFEQENFYSPLPEKTETENNETDPELPENNDNDEIKINAGFTTKNIYQEPALNKAFSAQNLNQDDDQNDRDSENDFRSPVFPLPTSVDELLSLPTDPEIVFRGDTRPPEIIFEEGFSAWGDNMDLVNHVRGTGGVSAEDSGYVATSQIIDVAKDSPPVTEPGLHESYVYAIAKRGDSVNISSAVEVSDPDDYYLDEQEIAFPRAIPSANIMGAYPVIRSISEEDESRMITMSDEMMNNPNYQFWTAEDFSMATFGVAGAASMAYLGYQDAVSLDNAFHESQETGNPDPFLGDAFRVGGAWASAYTAGEVVLGGAATIGLGEFIMAGAAATAAYRVGGDGEFAYHAYKDYADSVIEDAPSEPFQLPEFSPQFPAYSPVHFAQDLSNIPTPDFFASPNNNEHFPTESHSVDLNNAGFFYSPSAEDNFEKPNYFFLPGSLANSSLPQILVVGFANQGVGAAAYLVSNLSDNYRKFGLFYSPPHFENIGPDHPSDFHFGDPPQLTSDFIKSKNGTFNGIFVIDQNGQLQLSQRGDIYDPYFHSDLSPGPLPAAGEYSIFNGQKMTINNKTGHFKVYGDAVEQISLRAFKMAGFEDVIFKKYIPETFTDCASQFIFDWRQENPEKGGNDLILKFEEKFGESLTYKNPDKLEISPDVEKLIDQIDSNLLSGTTLNIEPNLVPRFLPGNLSFTSKMIGGYFLAWGAALDARNFYEQAQISRQSGNYHNTFNEGARIVSSWSSAFVGAEIGEDVGAVICAPVAPPIGSAVCAALGGAVGSVGGYSAGSEASFHYSEELANSYPSNNKNLSISGSKSSFFFKPRATLEGQNTQNNGLRNAH